MRCLHCEKELALLKKLTDGAFCSPDHRTRYFERLQLAVIERLADSGFRVGLKTRLQAKTADPTKYQKKEKLPPFASFLPIEAPAEKGYTLDFWNSVAFDNSDLLILPPELRLLVRSGPALGRFQVHFLHAQVGQNRLTNAHIEFLPFGSKATAGNLIRSASTRRISAAMRILRYSDPVRSDNAPDSRMAAADFSSFRSEPVQPQWATPAASAAQIPRSPLKRLDGPDSRLGNVGLHGSPNPQAGSNGAVTPELDAQISAQLKSATGLFRMRPKTGVSDSGIASYKRIDADVEIGSSKPLMQARPAEAAKLAPAALHRPFRMRARTGVVDPASPEFLTAPPEHATSEAKPDFGGAGTSLPSPTGPNAARPVTAAARALQGSMPYNGIDAGQPAELSSAPAIRGGGRYETELAPRLLDKAFRMRPRAGVTGGAAEYLASEDLGTETLLPIPRKPVQSAGAPACEPVAVQRLFRARPRAGVDSRDLLDMNRVDAAQRESFPVSPSIQNLPAAAAAISGPVFADRTFRMRPRGPVADSGLPGFSAIATGSQETVSAAPAIAAMPAELFAPAIPVTGKAFRMRPRGPVEGLLRPFEMLPCDAVQVPAPPAAILALPHPQAADLAPASKGKAFVMRPRGGVSGNGAAAYQRLVPVAVSLEPANAIAGLLAAPHAQFAPEFVDKLYRMRPRGPVAGAQQPAHIDSGAIELVLPLPLMPWMPPVLMRQATMSFRERPIKMKPRGPKSSTTASAHPIDPAIIEQEPKAAAS